MLRPRVLLGPEQAKVKTYKMSHPATNPASGKAVSRGGLWGFMTWSALAIHPGMAPCVFPPTRYQRQRVWLYHIDIDSLSILQDFDGFIHRAMAICTSKPLIPVPLPILLVPVSTPSATPRCSVFAPSEEGVVIYPIPLPIRHVVTETGVQVSLHTLRSAD